MLFALRRELRALDPDLQAQRCSSFCRARASQGLSQEHVKANERLGGVRQADPLRQVRAARLWVTCSRVMSAWLLEAEMRELSLFLPLQRQ